MRAYTDIVFKVLEYGEWKGNRTGERTLVIPNQHFSHDMRMGFPLLTTKRIAKKSMATELQGFIAGVTSKKWFQDRDCKIWNEWANPRVVERQYNSNRNIFPLDDGMKILSKEQIQEKEDDLGPIYGYQWRKFNAVYDEDCNGTMEPVDQFDEIVQKLKNNPNDRRLVCSAWNPIQIQRMALPPCHLLFVLTHINGKLNLHWTQRSCDLFLGVPFNIASYGLLLELFCKESGMKAGNLSGMLCDCHIYEGHINAMTEQLSRSPRKLPTLEFSKWDGIYNWQAKDCVFKDYNPHPSIKGNVAV